MISQCMNPECRRELHYLRDGRVVRSVQRDQEKVTLEHFWLCGVCLTNLEFCFSAEGRVSLTRRRVPRAASGEKTVELTLVA